MQRKAVLRHIIPDSFIRLFIRKLQPKTETVVGMLVQRAVDAARSGNEKKISRIKDELERLSDEGKDTARNSLRLKRNAIFAVALEEMCKLNQNVKMEMVLDDKAEAEYKLLQESGLLDNDMLKAINEISENGTLYMKVGWRDFKFTNTEFGIHTYDLIPCFKATGGYFEKDARILKKTLRLADRTLDVLERMQHFEKAVKRAGNDFFADMEDTCRECDHHKMRSTLGDFYSKADDGLRHAVKPLAVQKMQPKAETALDALMHRAVDAARSGNEKKISRAKEELKMLSEENKDTARNSLRIRRNAIFAVALEKLCALNPNVKIEMKAEGITLPYKLVLESGLLDNDMRREINEIPENGTLYMKVGDRDFLFHRFNGELRVANRIPYFEAIGNDIAKDMKTLEKTLELADETLNILERMSSFENVVGRAGENFISKSERNRRVYDHHKIRGAVGHFYACADRELKQ